MAALSYGGPEPIFLINSSFWDIGAGTIFRLGEQKLVKNNQDNQIQSITLWSMYFSKKVYAVYNGVWG